MKDIIISKNMSLEFEMDFTVSENYFSQNFRFLLFIGYPEICIIYCKWPFQKLDQINIFTCSFCLFLGWSDDSFQLCLELLVCSFQKLNFFGVFLFLQCTALGLTFLNSVTLGFQVIDKLF